jgi:hypothetical protein
MADSKTLQTSKKKLRTGAWGYRGFVVEKDKSSWIVALQDENSAISSEKIKEILDTKPSKTVKDVCFKIDEVLGPVPGNPKKTRTTRKPPKKEGEIIPLFNKEKLDAEDAKRLAYDIRSALKAKITESGVDYSEVKVEPTIPRRTKLGKNSFSLGWDEPFQIADEIVELFQEKYGDKYNISLNRENTKCDITVVIKDLQLD